MNYQDYAIRVLKEAGYRVTDQRRLVLEILMSEDGALNPYEIVALSEEGLDVSTVYRILEVFQQLGLVHLVKELQKFVACKDFSCGNKQHCHHQFVCNSCKGVSEIHVDDSKLMVELQDKLTGFQIDSHYLEFSGICKNCLTKI